MTVGAHNPFKPVYACDKLGPDARSKLDKIMQEIDGNLDALQEEKKEYFKAENQSTSKISRLTDGSNAFSFQGANLSKIRELDLKLQSVNP